MKPVDLFIFYTETLRQEYQVYIRLVELHRQGIGVCDPKLLERIAHLAAQQQQVWHRVSELQNDLYFMLAATPPALNTTDPHYAVRRYRQYVDVPTWVRDPEPPENDQ